MRARPRALQRLELRRGQQALQPLGGEGAGDGLLVEDEVADLAVFLASARASYISGVVMTVMFG